MNVKTKILLILEMFTEYLNCLFKMSIILLFGYSIATYIASLQPLFQVVDVT